MAKSVDEQIKAAMAKKVVGRTTEIYKAVVLELYKRITANSLPYAQALEQGHSKFKAPEGIYGVAAEQVAQKFKGATKITLSGLKGQPSSIA
jgi:hypothetical protein